METSQWAVDEANGYHKKKKKTSMVGFKQKKKRLQLFKDIIIFKYIKGFLLIKKNMCSFLHVSQALNMKTQTHASLLLLDNPFFSGVMPLNSVLT